MQEAAAELLAWEQSRLATLESGSAAEEEGEVDGDTDYEDEVEFDPWDFMRSLPYVRRSLLQLSRPMPMAR
jgi:hypothetical protein